MIRFSLIILAFFVISPLIVSDVFAQVGFGDSPFERKFGDVKFLDAYFGTEDEKLEIDPGDRNVPFTVVLANVGTQDITGIRGQLSLPFTFGSADGPGSLIEADSDSSSLAGETFSLTFFVNISNQADIKQYPGSVKVDYSRLRESGIRNAFFDFNFKVTGDSIINMRALDPFLISLKTNHVVIEVANDGTAPISGVDIVAQNTQTAISSTTASVTNIENVVILDTNWDIGHIDPGTAKYLEANIYIPETLKGVTLRVPMELTYFNAHGDQHTISRIVDFYIIGLIDAKIYDVKVIELSGKPTVIGEIINEGNDDALFGFVTLEPLEGSNIIKSTQFIDEIETDSPVPFNAQIEFDGEPRYGEHDIRITVRYKDALRDEHFLTYDTTVFINDPSKNQESEIDYSQFLIIPVIAGVGIFAFSRIRKKKHEQAT
ncbi:hypothetical protein LCGC14_1613960 [marine sediment metagenome]|uniref:CARDB domain-containing protein n=1 Tax=marine sediment metagenome TaxID=412755 RepID=A0A0F9KN60_9ZZZZ